MQGRNQLLFISGFSLFLIYSKTFWNSVFKGTLKAFDDYKNKQKGVWSNDFSYVEVNKLLKFIQYTTGWDKTQVLKNNSIGQDKRYKNAVFFFSWASAHYSFISNSRVLYDRNHKVRLSKSACRVFHFRFCLIFIKVFIYLFIYLFFQ